MARILIPALVLSTLLGAAPQEGEQWVVYEGGDGMGKGKHIVFVSGDEEYRSEEGMPQMAKILSKHHGFKCTVLFAVDKKTGEINPNTRDNIPGLEALGKADVMVLFTRMRELPDDQMKHIIDYVDRGGPIVALRTATHPFSYGKNSTSAYKKYGWNDKEYSGGFGRQILGETWVSHHGAHGKESCRGVIVGDAKRNQIVRGCEDIWGPTDVYGVKLPEDCTPLVMGQVLQGMKPTDKPVEGKKNDPMMCIAWTRNHTGASGKTSRTFTTTMGASQDLLSEGLRRLVVNACYWAVGLENRIPEKANVEIVGKYEPTPFGFNTYKKGVKPADHK